MLEMLKEILEILWYSFLCITLLITIFTMIKVPFEQKEKNKKFNMLIENINKNIDKASEIIKDKIEKEGK